MVLTVLIGFIVAICFVSLLIAYVFMHSQENSKRLINEKQQIRHTFIPSMNIITQKLRNHTESNRTSLTNSRSSRSSSTLNHDQVNQVKNSRRSTDLIKPFLSPQRSTSMGSSLLQIHRPRSTNWRQGSIIDPQQLALIQFTVPSNNRDEKYRRRSVAVCNSINDSKENPLPIMNTYSPCLLTFSVIYLKNSQLKIELNSLQSLPNNLQLQQLTVKMKLYPDGKEKSLQIRKFIENEIFFQNQTEQNSLLFSNIHPEKIHEKSLLITLHGKDRTKKSIHLGQIGKVSFNQIKQFENENPIEFIQEIEKIKPSSIELLLSLEKKNEQFLYINLQRIKGLKVDQKKLDATCYLQILLLDRHRPLAIKQTKFYRLNSSHFDLGEKYDFNILAYNSNHLDRLIIQLNFYSNSNHSNEYKRIAHMKISSPLFCSGSGTIHWQQFQARESFSMWHTLNK